MDIASPIGGSDHKLELRRALDAKGSQNGGNNRTIPGRLREFWDLMHRSLLPLLVALLFCANTSATLTDSDTTSVFVSATRAYDNRQYETAVELFEAVLTVQPTCARCAHMLGKSYGRLAEQAGWTDAIGLANKTRLALEQAVELAPNDPEALRDLIKYYRAAPGFLGGSEEKAQALEKRLLKRQTERTS